MYKIVPSRMALALTHYFISMVYPMIAILSCSGSNTSGLSLNEAEAKMAQTAMQQALAPLQDLIVWTYDQDRKISSYWVRANEITGILVASRTGMLFPIDTSFWELQQDMIEFPLCDCEQWRQNSMRGSCPEASTIGQGNVLKFVDMISNRELEIVPKKEIYKDIGFGDREYSFDVSLAGSIGPFLFVLFNVERIPCGANRKSSSSEYYIIDMRKEVQVDILEPLEWQRIAEEEQTEAFEQLQSDPNLDLRSPKDLCLTGIKPLFLSDRGLTVGYMFTSNASFADSNGNWSSYSRSTTVAAKHVPTALSPYIRVPLAVHRFIMLAPKASVGGWIPINRTTEVMNFLHTAFGMQSRPEDS